MGNELKQTKGIFKILGTVQGLGKEGAYVQDTAQRGKNEGKDYRKLRFGVKTSPVNTVNVDMYEVEPEMVNAYSSKEKASKWFPYSQRDSLPEGYAIISNRLGLEYGKDGKLQSKGIVPWDMAEAINKGLTNGDTVVAEGELRFSEYMGQDGKMRKQRQLSLKRLHKQAPIDFNAENYEEVSYFEQQFVFVDAEDDKELKKVFVTGRVIDYRKNFIDVQFVIDYSDNDPDMKKLAGGFANRMQFGDLVDVSGEVVNRLNLVEIEEEDDEEDDFAAMFGGKAKPKHAQRFTSRSYTSELQIQRVEDYSPEHYEEDDFVKDDLIEEEVETNHVKEFGGKPKKKVDPFEFDEEDVEIEDDSLDLPF